MHSKAISPALPNLNACLKAVLTSLLHPTVLLNALVCGGREDVAEVRF
jgi:hypothetical protein